MTVKLSQLPNAPALTTSTLFYVVQGGITYKATGTQLKALMFPSGGTTGQGLAKASGSDYDFTFVDFLTAVNWGDIGGTLSDQTDLQAALDTKLESVDWGDIGGTLSSQTDLQNALNAKRSLGTIDVVVATEAGSTTIPDGSEHLLLEPAAGLTAYTVTMPATPSEGVDVLISAGSFGITGLTLSPNSGQSFATGAAISTLPASAFAKYRWRSSSSTWYRIG